MQEENQEFDAFWEWGIGNWQESLFTNMGCSQIGLPITYYLLPTSARSLIWNQTVADVTKISSY